jgi:hybrid polyketide synthase/nonribosomal peptide synthetase ACE1
VSVVDVPEILGIDTETRLPGEALLSPISESCFHTLMAEAIQFGLHQSSQSTHLITALKPLPPSCSSKVPKWRSDPKFSHLILSSETATISEIDESAQSIKQRLLHSTEPKSALNLLRQCFIMHLTTMLSLTANALKDDVDLVGLGIDSLMASDVRSWFLKELDVDLPVLKVLGGSTVMERK